MNKWYNMAKEHYVDQSQADEMYMTYLDCSDLDYGEPVYATDGMWIFPDGFMYDES